MSTRRFDEERIDEARRELGGTDVRPGVAVVLCAVFAAALAAVPLLEMLAGGAAPLPGFAGEPVQCSLRALERRLDEDTRAAQNLRPAVQTALLALGAGNALADVGRDGWLFQREAVTSVTGRSFLAPDVQRRRRSGADECGPLPHTDPLAAVRAFRRDLAARGIELVLLPTPAKASVRPDRLSARYEEHSPSPRNPGFAPFVAALRAEGARVFDPLPALRASLRTGSDGYLATDTHWRPEAVEAVAAALAPFLEEQVPLSPPAPALAREPADARNLGDVAVLLGALPGAVAPEEVTVQRVVDAVGEPWRPNAAAEVLLLGDSFSNVYSDRAAFARDAEGLDWGGDAGLAEQLSFRLQRPVARIVRNDSGAFATRQELARSLARGEELAGLRVVVWQFAERELAFGDWRPVELPRAAARGPTATGGGPRTVRGTIADRSRLPAAGASPYPEALLALRLVGVEVLEGEAAPAEILVYVWGLRDRRPTAEAGLAVGEALTVTIQPWQAASVQERYGGLARSELEDDEALFLPAFWGETVP